MDDILAVSHNPTQIMRQLDSLYRLKEDKDTGEKFAPPKTYLGSNMGKHKLSNGNEAWYMAADDYVKEAVKVVEATLLEGGQKLATKVSGPIASGYRPELDTSPELGDQQANYYHNLIGVLRWAVELG